MATSEELQQLVGKVMLDPIFRRAFAGDPAAAATTVNIQLSPEEVQSFKSNMAAFVSGAAELEKGAATTATASPDAAAAAGHIAAIFRQ